MKRENQIFRFSWNDNQKSDVFKIANRIVETKKDIICEQCVTGGISGRL